MHQRIKPWHLILLGIGLTISAALIQHVLVEQRYHELEQLMSKINRLDTRINSLWQQHIEAERKKEFAALLWQADAGDRQSSVFLNDYLTSLATDTHNGHAPDTTQMSLQASLALISDHQATLREQIDDLYFERITVGEAQAPLLKTINQGKNIALLMQLLGLILVLSKDLARNNT